MPPATELLNAFAATSLLGYLGGRPLSTLLGGGAPPFLLGGVLVGGGALLVAGWPVEVAVLAALAGSVVGFAFDRIVGGPGASAEEFRDVSQPPERISSSGRGDGEGAHASEDRVSDEAPVAVTPEESTPADMKLSEAKSETAEQASDEVPEDDDAIPLKNLSGSRRRVESAVSGGAARERAANDSDEISQAVEEIETLSDTCPHCQTKNELDARFCRSCSGPLQAWTCEECEAENTRDSKFCVSCRAPLQMLASPLDVEDVRA